MKTIIQFSKLLALPFLAALIAVGCGKSNDSTPAVTYSYLNGICYSNQNGTQQQVPSYNCSATSGYTYMNNQCYTTSGQPVSINYCSGTTGAYSNQACIGTYMASNGQQGVCNGANCRGYTLSPIINGQVGQPVLCQ